MPLTRSIGLIILLIGLNVRAEEVKVVMPEDLPSESVVPRLDSPWAVQNRKLKFEKRSELSLGATWFLDETWLNNQAATLDFTMNLSNRWGLGFKIGSFATGGTTYANQYAEAPYSLKFDLVPQPKFFYGLTVQDRLFYGKWSFSQDSVFPMVIQAFYDLVLVDYTGKALTYFAVGLAQKTYFGQTFGIGLGYKVMARQAIAATSARINSTANPATGDFEVVTKISQGLDFTLNFLF
jgi:hypothetical protein